MQHKVLAREFSIELDDITRNPGPEAEDSIVESSSYEADEELYGFGDSEEHQEHS